MRNYLYWMMLCLALVLSGCAGKPSGHFEGLIVYFTDDRELDSEAKNILDSNSKKLAKAGLVSVVGYTEITGTREFNYALGDSLAQMVRQYLVEQGISSDKITVHSRGEAHPPPGAGASIGDLERNARVLISWN